MQTFTLLVGYVTVLGFLVAVTLYASRFIRDAYGASRTLTQRHHVQRATKIASWPHGAHGRQGDGQMVPPLPRREPGRALARYRAEHGVKAPGGQVDVPTGLTVSEYANRGIADLNAMLLRHAQRRDSGF